MVSMVSVKPFTGRGSYQGNKLHMIRTPNKSQSGTRSVHFGDPSRSLPVVLDEYECPPLPPVLEMKSAIARQKVGDGVSYVLPVDKTKNSVENVFRTNLRVMFQEPYRNKVQQLDTAALRAIAKHQYKTNTCREKYNWKLPTAYQVNSDSRKAREEYAKSAPTTGAHARRTLGNTEQRSKLYLPFTDNAPQEVQNIKSDAEKIVKSVMPVGLQEMGMLSRSTSAQIKGNGRILRAAQSGSPRPSKYVPNILQRSKSTPLTTPHARLTCYDTYDVLNSVEAPKEREVPPHAKSPFLTEGKTKEVWAWLHNGEPQSDLDFFLEACS